MSTVLSASALQWPFGVLVVVLFVVVPQELFAVCVSSCGVDVPGCILLCASVAAPPILSDS